MGFGTVQLLVQNWFDMAGRHLPCQDFVETLPLDDIYAHPVPAPPPEPATVSPNISPEERRNKYQNVWKCGEETIELGSTPEPSQPTGTSDKNDKETVEKDSKTKPKVKEQEEKFTDTEDEVGALMGWGWFWTGTQACSSVLT